MEADEFLLVRDMFRTFAGRFRTGSADLDPAARATAQKALDELGLTDLRAATLPTATAQECALLAEEHGKQPLPTSLLGTALLAPELLRLLGGDGLVRPAGKPTVGLARDLRFIGARTGGLVAWDCEGADSALCVAVNGMVSRVELGPPVPGIDMLRAMRSIPEEARGTTVGRLDAAALRQWRAFALVMVSSEMVGAASSFVGQAVEYAGARRQYGREIGTFQAVQHLLADATFLVEAATSATRYAAWCLDNESPATALTAAGVAKAEANSSALEAVYIGMQVFGGIAQTWEHIAHLYLRRVRLDAVTLATTEDLLTTLADPEANR